MSICLVKTICRTMLSNDVLWDKERDKLVMRFNLNKKWMVWCLTIEEEHGRKHKNRVVKWIIVSTKLQKLLTLSSHNC